MKKLMHSIKTVSVRFLNRINRGEKLSQDLYCTAISRCAKKGKKVIIEVDKHRCSGGNYFVGNSDVDAEEIEDVYMNKEKVFRNKRDLGRFLKLAGRNPVKSKYIVFEPKINEKTDVVVLLLNPDDAGRILGINAYAGGFEVDIVPAISTCASIYRPLIKKNAIHVNFIDYFDRKYQCRGFFEKSELIASMPLKIYKKMYKIFEQTSHGSNSPENMKIFRVPEL